jgi:ubiquinone/menaquinone biosynthesis C-methylase UbiE
MPHLLRRYARLSLEQWETYYRGGAISTCPTGPDGGYDLEVRDAWVDFFTALPDGARVLDIGTGNGVVPLIAAETAAANGRSFGIHGADLARIDPVKHVADGARRFAGITFHPGVATEKLPFDAASFDAVSGHYAFEYAEPAAALAAIHRVLKPGGSVQFIVHHAQSALIRSALLSLREAAWLFTENKLYRRLHKVVTMVQTTGQLTQPAAVAAHELRTSIQALKQSIPHARSTGGGRVLTVALDAAQKLLAMRQRATPDSTGIEVDRAEQDMRASVRRLNDLVGHARSDEDMATLEALAVEAGFEVVERTPQLHAGNNLVGWRLRLRKP